MQTMQYIQHAAVPSSRGGGFQRLRLMPPTLILDLNLKDWILKIEWWSLKSWQSGVWRLEVVGLWKHNDVGMIMRVLFFGHDVDNQN